MDIKSIQRTKIGAPPTTAARGDSDLDYTYMGAAGIDLPPRWISKPTSGPFLSWAPFDGLFATSKLIEKNTLRPYQVKLVGQLDVIRMRYYAISPERRITNPAVTAIINAAATVPSAKRWKKVAR